MKFRKIAREILSINNWKDNRRVKEYCIIEYTKIILCCPSLADNYEIKSYDIANDDAVGLEVNVLKNDMVSFKVANKAQLFSHEIRIDSGVESIGLFARTWGRVDGVVYFTDIKKIDSL